nr:unnamed protein product [Callosobruchus chinensis]
MSPDEATKLPKTNTMENVLHNALLMTEIGIDLKDGFIAGEKYINQLKTILLGADKAISALHSISKSSLEQAQHILASLVQSDFPNNAFKQECDRLLGIVEKQLLELELSNSEASCTNLGMEQLSDKIRYLESKQKNLEAIISPHTSSSKNVRADINEKYPENLSRESLIDLNTVNLPPVPEDIFTSFNNRPKRSSSLSSLKSMRKIKMFLQRAESSDDEDSSENDERDYPRSFYGDSEDGKPPSPHSPLSKKVLGNIKEEAHD